MLNAKTQLSVVIAINQRVFLKNTSGQEQTLPAGTIIAGWFKGKYWHYRRDGLGEPQAKKSKKAAEEEITEVTDADVLFSLKSADQMVAMNGKSAMLLDVLTEKRKTHPDASVQYHKLHDKPGPGNPGFFTLETEVQIYFRGEDVPTKGGEEGVPKIVLHHLAGCIKASSWQTVASQITWAVKWSQTAGKGLTPVRPMVQF